MLRGKKRNVRSAEASHFRLENDLPGITGRWLRMIDQFNLSSSSDLSSEHGGELYSHRLKNSYIILQQTDRSGGRISRRFCSTCATPIGERKYSGSMMCITPASPTCASAAGRTRSNSLCATQATILLSIF